VNVCIHRRHVQWQTTETTRGMTLIFVPTPVTLQLSLVTSGFPLLAALFRYPWSTLG
jgi:hypothetical protein